MSVNILVIEDEPDIRKNLEYNLGREGFKASSVGSLDEANEKIKSKKFDLILLDLMLPDGSGLDLCKKIKSNSETEATPIIILTAKDDEVDKVVGFELGADDYVTKPFSVRELILRVKAILKRSDTKTKKVVEVERHFGDLKIDVDSHEVHVDSQLIELTALEFRLLKELVDKRGRVQSRDQLLSEVWGYNAEVTTRTVDTHIKRLREKLGSMGKYVQTIRGVAISSQEHRIKNGI